MNDRFSPAAAGSLPGGDDRPGAATRAGSVPLPDTETEEWRYSSIGEAPLAAVGPSLSEPVGGATDPLPEITERAATITVIDGWPTSVEVARDWAAKGLSVTVDRSVTWSAGERTDEETTFDLLHRAFAPAAVVISVADGVEVSAPVVVVERHRGGPVAAFSHLVVTTGDAAAVTVVHHQGSDGPGGVSVPVVELTAGPASRLRYQQVQERDHDHWSFGRQWSRVEAQGTLVSGTAAFGGRYARIRLDSHLVGRGADAEVIAAYYGHGDQVHDFRVFQHHDARDTRSDLLFKGVQDGASGSVYTGMIHIHPDGAGSRAFQTNRNVKLSPDAWAWSVPNLEIENNDVRCSHASTVSPVDPEQQFYLQSRGVHPVVADRLIVEGFFDDVIDRLPSPVLRGRIEALVAAKLNERTGS